jgi:hypothetical protein
MAQAGVESRPIQSAEADNPADEMAFIHCGCDHGP